jgi:DNA-binding transcriptional ArsR family regulator
MDTKKDNIPQDGVTPYKPAYSSILFHNNEKIYYLYRKVESVVAALFLVTDSSQDQHGVLRDEVRKHSLKCLMSITQFIASERLTLQTLQVVSADMLHLHSLIQAGFWSGVFSEMNSSILQKEIMAAYVLGTDLMEQYKNKFSINPALFSNQEVSPEDYKRQTQSAISQDSASANRTGIYKGQDKRHDQIKDIKDRVKKDTVSDSKLDRREKILKVLAHKNNLNVKDFTQVIMGVSEKTIQRELLSLVDEKLIKKEGERRWSTYSLNM